MDDISIVHAFIDVIPEPVSKINRLHFQKIWNRIINIL